MTSPGSASQFSSFDRATGRIFRSPLSAGTSTTLIPPPLTGSPRKPSAYRSSGIFTFAGSFAFTLTPNRPSSGSALTVTSAGVRVNSFPAAAFASVSDFFSSSAASPDVAPATSSSAIQPAVGRNMAGLHESAVVRCRAVRRLS